MSETQPTYHFTSGAANPLALAADGQRFVSTDWWEEDPNQDRCVSHVMLYQGYDLSAAGIWQPEFSPCSFCDPTPSPQEPALLLTDERLPSKRLVHFVCCGNCGARGPWGNSESQGLALWNAVSAQQRVHTERLNSLLAGVREAFNRECDDADSILCALGLKPENCRTDGGLLKVQMIVGALQHRNAMLKREAAWAAAASERHACSIAVWMTLQDALAPDADDKGLDGWMREAEARVKRRT